MRNTVVAALAGTLIGLLIASIIFVLVSATLYWYADEDESLGLPPSAAQAYALAYVREIIAEGGGTGWLVDCEAGDRVERSWLVNCDMAHRGDELSSYTFTYLVGDDGAVAPFP